MLEQNDSDNLAMKSNRRTWCELCVQQVQRRARRKTNGHETLDERKSDVIFDRLFLVFILMHPVINFRCGREPENAEKTQDV